MKKSEIYHLAQITVVNAPLISPERKLEMLRILMNDEDVALYSERKEAEKATAEAEKVVAE